MKGLREKKGITLIALIVTVIILLILAGMSVSMISGEGLFQKAKTSTETYKKSASKEAIELLMAEYQMENASTGVTLEQFLEDEGYTEGVDYDKDGDNITFYEGEYAIILNTATGEVEEPTKTDKIVKLKANKKIVNLNETLTVTVEYGSGVDIANCKYKIVNTGAVVGEITTALGGTTINVPTTNIGRYTVYLKVEYKDNTESTTKHIDLQVGTPVTSITLNKNSTEINKTQKETLTATVLPANASDPTVTWSSGDTSIATVNASTGEVTGVGVGTTTITATAADGSGISASCSVTIIKGELSSISLSGIAKTSYTAGETLDLTGATVTATYTSGLQEDVTSSCTFTPSNGTTLSTSNTQVIASYTENEINKTANTSITVTPAIAKIIPTTLSGVGYRDSDPREHAIDGDRNTYWYGGSGSTVNFNFTFDKVYIFKKCEIHVRNPESQGIGYTLKVYGGNTSADGDSGWTELATLNTGTLSAGQWDPQSRYENNNVVLNNISNSYMYMRLYATGGGYMPKLAEISFYGYEP